MLIEYGPLTQGLLYTLMDSLGTSIWSVTLVPVELQKLTVTHFKALFLKKQLISLQHYSQAEIIVARAISISP